MAKKKSAPAKEEILYSSRSLIRHAYDEVITRSARLASFSASPLLKDMSAVEDRQDELAIADLIVFALHLRRLIEMTNTGKIVRAASIELIREGKKENVPVTTIVNKIIHHRRLDILRRRSDFMAPPGPNGEALLEWLKARQEGLYPIMTVQADSGGFIGMRIADFILAAHQGITKPIVDYCDDRNLYLEDMDID